MRRTRPRTPSWWPDDPGLFALRGAVRAGIVVPIAFAIGEAAGSDPDIGLFAAFGSVALMILVDFSGPAAARLAAYVALALAGAVLIPIGTLCSHSTAVAAAVMAAIGFVVLMAGVIDGYLAAGGAATLLTFILPVMVPGDAGQIGARLEGWGIACALAIPAILLLWPRRPRDALLDGSVAACRAVAGLVERPGAAERSRAAREAIATLRHAFLATPYRPTGPAGATGALARLIDELDWLRALIEAPGTGAGAGAGGSRAPAPGVDARLRAVTAGLLRVAAARLAGDQRAAPDLDELEGARTAVVDELVECLADPGLRDDDERLWAAFFGAWRVRVASYAAREIAVNAVEATGGAPAPGHRSRWARFVGEQARALAASRRLAAVHASVRSVWFRNSVRGAVGLSIAVLVAQLTSVQHAFWVVLGALSVLRSSALGTGSTIVRALGGTALGIVVGGALLVAIGGDRTLLWALLPVAVALAAYSPRAISFAAGQAGFTVTVLILFNLIEPSGWRVGLVRIEDVSIGFAISLVVGLLFWPTGARALLRASVADALVRSADYVSAAFERLLGGGEATATAPLRDEAVVAERRLDAALRQRLAERQGPSVALDACGTLSAGATRVRRTADAMEYLSNRIGATPRPPESRGVLDADVRALREWHLALASALASRTQPPPAQPAAARVRPAVLAAVRAAVVEGDRARTVAALATGWGAMHVETLTDLEARLAQAAARLHR